VGQNQRTKGIWFKVMAFGVSPVAFSSFFPVTGLGFSPGSWNQFNGLLGIGLKFA